MKKNILILIIALPALITACCTAKSKAIISSKTQSYLFEGAWELEYISGPRISFEGLYPEKKPYIIFTAAENQFGGNSSCNVYSGKYTIKDDNIKFGDVIKTMIFCEGGGEETFLKMLGKVNKYTVDGDGKLILLTDNTAIMRFKKIAKPQQ